ncbi:MAG: hypothetical protein ACRYG8_44430 [Janthinobacterium lividum]
MMERERFALGQALMLDEMFALTDGEGPARQGFERLALDTYDALASQSEDYVPFHLFSILPSSALCPASNKLTLERLPLPLRREWVAWEEGFEDLVGRHPRLTLYDMLSWISETHTFSSWPARWEGDIRDWVDGGSITPMPFDDRLGIITPEFYARLRQARERCRGWLYWDGKEVRFIPDPT